jgi:hypothetical protein
MLRAADLQVLAVVDGTLIRIWAKGPGAVSATIDSEALADYVFEHWGIRDLSLRQTQVVAETNLAAFAVIIDKKISLHDFQVALRCGTAIKKIEIYPEDLYLGPPLTAIGLWTHL